MRRDITIAFSKRETNAVYVFDVLELIGTNSFKIGSAAVNVKTGEVCCYGAFEVSEEFLSECGKVAQDMSRLFTE